MKQDNGIEKKGSPVDMLPLSQRHFDGWSTSLLALKSAGLTLLFLSTVAAGDAARGVIRASGGASVILAMLVLTGCAGTKATQKTAEQELSPTVTHAIAKCPSVVRTNGWVYFYTNCVLANKVQLATNGWSYGAVSFTAYVNTNKCLEIEAGSALPSDWIGAGGWVSDVHTWTLQYAFDLSGPWQDAASTGTAQSYAMFAAKNAFLPQLFFRAKVE